MSYEIKLTNAEAILTAVIRSRVHPRELSKFVPAACGEVWSFIRSSGLPRPGRHTALYLDSGLVEVGAEVSERFASNERVHCSQLPAGRVATTTHFGPYGRLGDAHSAVRQWCAAQGQHLSNICWEIYGHWDERMAGLFFVFVFRTWGLSQLYCWMKAAPAISLAAICAAVACGCRKSPVSSSSMSPTITNGEQVTVNYTAYVLSKPKRWDVAVFGGPPPVTSTNPSAKRVIALPSETISFSSNAIVVNGRPLIMPPALSNAAYLPPEKWGSGPFIVFPYTVPARHYFVLGDNMSNSLDSRYYGAVSETNLLGKVEGK